MSEQFDGPGLNNQEFVDLTDQTLSPLLREVSKFNKKTAGEAWSFFKRILGTVTEPYFRKAMGERYYTPEVFGAGVMIWVAGTLVNCAICAFYGVTASIITIIWGCLLTWNYAHLGRQSLFLMVKYRNEGTAYHTRSRGTSRWGNKEILVFIILAIVFLFMNTVFGVVFVVGYFRNLTLKAEQDEAIRSRYLDALDADIENKYLEGAALGECPTEITYLDKPIDEKWIPEVRKNMAAALVGKPVSGIARHPQRKADSQQPIKSEPKPTTKDQTSSGDEVLFYPTRPEKTVASPISVSPQNARTEAAKPEVETSAQTPSAPASKPATEWDERENDFIAQNPPETEQKIVVATPKLEAPKPAERVSASKPVKPQKRAPSNVVKFEMKISEESMNTSVQFECEGKVEMHPLWHVINNYIAEGKEIQMAESTVRVISGDINGTKVFVPLDQVLRHFSESKEKV